MAIGQSGCAASLAPTSARALIGRLVSDQVIESPEAGFVLWLSWPASKQAADLEAHVIENHACVVVWLDARAYDSALPASSGATERRLFRCDLEALLPMLRNEHGGRSPNGGSGGWARSFEQSAAALNLR
jgi:hypothetical protein